MDELSLGIVFYAKFVFSVTLHEASHAWAAKRGGDPTAYESTGHNIVPTYPAPAVGNLDDDPGLEIVIPTYDGLMYAFSPNG